jgi:hypothetical protein
VLVAFKYYFGEDNCKFIVDNERFNEIKSLDSSFHIEGQGFSCTKFGVLLVCAWFIFLQCL